MGRYYDDFAHSGMEEGDDILHYGVLGMKWGIRRYQPYSYTGGSGKEVGEAKKLAKLSAKSAKLDKKINKLEKKRTNRFAIATNARVRGRAGDKQQKLIKKKAKVDKKIEDQKKEYKTKVAEKNLRSAIKNIYGSATDAKSKGKKGADNQKINKEAIRQAKIAASYLDEKTVDKIFRSENIKEDIRAAIFKPTTFHMLEYDNVMSVKSNLKTKKHR